MNTRRLLPLGAIAAATLAVGLWAAPLTAQHAEHGQHIVPAGTPTAPPTTAPSSMQAMHQEQLALVEQALKGIDAAASALQGGDRDKALAELKAARDALAKHRQAMAEHCQAGGCPMMQRGGMMHHGQPASQPGAQSAAPAGAGGFANVRCPIMGSPIDPARVPQSLTRQYNGQTVAFCCPGCPAAWDKLTEAQKEAKLNAVRAPAQGQP